MADLQKEFIALIDNHQRILHKVANLYCNTPEERRDLVQEMLLQAWRSYPGFRAEAAFSTWLYRLALNTAIVSLKKESRRPDRYPTNQLPPIADEGDSHETERLNLLNRAIKQLSDVDKALITLYLDELPYQEIADILGISPNNVAVKINRLKDKLSAIISKLEA